MERKIKLVLRREDGTLRSAEELELEVITQIFDDVACSNQPFITADESADIVRQAQAIVQKTLEDA